MTGLDDPGPAGPRCRTAQAAYECLASSSYVPLRHLQCECHQGRLILRGQVPNFYLKQLAQALVAEVPGVSEVHNRIVVGEPVQR
jgi:osmotically-inducible protein OsmY